MANEYQNSCHCDKLHGAQTNAEDECLNACDLIAKFNFIKLHLIDRVYAHVLL